MRSFLPPLVSCLLLASPAVGLTMVDVAAAAETPAWERGDHVLPGEACVIRWKGAEVSIKGRMLPLVVQSVDGDEADLGIGRAPLNSLVRIEQAVEYYTDWLAREPRSVDAYHMRSIAYEHRVEIDKVIEDLTSAIELAPNAARLYVKRAVARSALVDDRGNILNPERIAEDADRVLRLDPNDIMGAILKLRVANEAAENEFYASSQLMKLNRYEAKDEYALYRLARALGDFNLRESAIQKYDEVIRLNPYCSTALSQRAIAWMKLEKFDRALADHDRAVEVDPKSPLTLINRAGFLAFIGRKKEALAVYARIVELNPNDWQIRCAYAEQLVQVADPELRNNALAMEMAKTAHALNPKIFRTVFILGVAHGDMGQFNAGLELLHKARGIERRSDDVDEATLETAIQRLAIEKRVYHD